MNKKRRKELRNIYEYIKGEQYVKEIQKEPSISWFEYIELKSKQVGYLDTVSEYPNIQTITTSLLINLFEIFF